MKTIPIEQLSAYFPYNVKAKFQETNKPRCRKYVIGTVGGIYSDSRIVCHDVVNSFPDRFKLMLHRLNTKQIADTNFILEYDIALFQRDPYSINHLTWELINILLRNHVDIFGLIDAGLAEEI